MDVVYFPDAEVISLIKKANSADIERALPFEQIPDASGKPGWNYHAYGLPKMIRRLNRLLTKNWPNSGHRASC